MGDSFRHLNQVSIPFKAMNHIFDFKLTTLESLNTHAVVMTRLQKVVDHYIKVTVLDPQSFKPLLYLFLFITVKRTPSRDQISAVQCCASTTRIMR